MSPIACSLALAGLLLGAASVGTQAFAQGFPKPGLWDPQPLDADVRAPASIGATIAGARASVNSRNTGSAGGRVQQATGVQEGCSLQIASPVLPEGSTSGRTIVLQSEIHGSVIQVCR